MSATATTTWSDALHVTIVDHHDEVKADLRRSLPCTIRSILTTVDTRHRYHQSSAKRRNNLVLMLEAGRTSMTRVSTIFAAANMRDAY